MLLSVQMKPIRRFLRGGRIAPCTSEIGSFGSQYENHARRWRRAFVRHSRAKRMVGKAPKKCDSGGRFRQSPAVSSRPDLGIPGRVARQQSPTLFHQAGAVDTIFGLRKSPVNTGFFLPCHSSKTQVSIVQEATVGQRPEFSGYSFLVTRNVRQELCAEKCAVRPANPSVLSPNED